ncbi:MAG TPA: response regulator transcription factor [Phycisphaerales bacterium]|nr:response regulator transcription factor [Phycisphaerales bacterium]
MSIRTIIADDHKIIRDGLTSLLDNEEDIEVVAQAADGHTAVELVRKMIPDVVIMDIGMPGLNGIEATRQITSEIPYIKVVALSMHSDKKFVTEMLKAGASGYLLKNCAFEELATAIRTVMDGKTYLSPAMAELIVDNYVRKNPGQDDSAFSVLTNREREVLQLLAESSTTKQAARQLHISTKTVETHRLKIMKKLNLDNMVALTKYAVREGLTSLD